MNEQIKKHAAFPSFKELCVKTWGQFQIEWQKKMIIAIGIVAVIMIFSMIRESLFQTEGSAVIAIEIIVQIILVIASIYGGILIMFAVRSPKSSYAELLKMPISFMLPYLGLSILLTVCIGIGFAALIIPGIVITTILGFAPYELLFNKKGVFESFGWSARNTFKYFWSIWYRWLGFSLLTTVPFLLIMAIWAHGLANGAPVTLAAIFLILLAFILEYAHVHFGYSLWSALHAITDNETAQESVPAWHVVAGTLIMLAFAIALGFVIVSILVSFGCMAKPDTCPFI